MKKTLLLLLLLTGFTVQASEASPLSQETKELIFDAITQYVYFEDDGFERTPQRLDDFIFTIVDDLTVRAVGISYSIWDVKDIGYFCDITVSTDSSRGNSKTISVKSCSLEGENWPHL